MLDVIFPTKAVLATVPLQFDFLSRLAVGETITGQVCTAAVLSGVDALPSAILDGGATVSGKIVTQLVQDGIAGVIYLINCQVSTNLGNQLILQGTLAVIDTNPYA